MSLFVIAGKPDCPNFVHALTVAELLNKKLPQFRYKPIRKIEGDWQVWLDELNTSNKWYQTKSPIIWKEVYNRGGKTYLIGGLSEFWEYCCDYYGFSSHLSKGDLENIIETSALHIKPANERFIIGVFGALNPMLPLLVNGLQDCFPLEESDNIRLRLYDFDYDHVENTEFLLDTIEDMQSTLKWNPHSISLVKNLPDVLRKCNLLLVIHDFSRLCRETIEEWLDRCMMEMLLLAEEINTFARRSLKVVFCHEGPVCFNASILVENCTKIRLANIVAVTSHEAMPFIKLIARECNEPIKNICCPPVWGFTGILSYVDLDNTVIKGEVYKPFQRVLAQTENSKLPKGIIHDELRFVFQLTKNTLKMHEEIEERKFESKKWTPRTPILVKLRTLISLLKLWFSKEVTDDIISLGICSNGSFGLPAGIVLSQPVIQNEKRLWEPVSNFPTMTNTQTRIGEIISEIMDLLKKYGLEKKID